MELKELMEKLPQNYEVRVYSIAGDEILLRTTPFGFTQDSDLGLKYGKFAVKKIEFSFFNFSYDVIVERIVRNIDKLQELYPLAKVEETFSGVSLDIGIDGKTRFTKEWLYAPYNEEEGKEE